MEDFDTKKFEIDYVNRTLPYLVENRAKELGDKVFFMFCLLQMLYISTTLKVRTDGIEKSFRWNRNCPATHRSSCFFGGGRWIFPV